MKNVHMGRIIANYRTTKLASPKQPTWSLDVPGLQHTSGSWDPLSPCRIRREWVMGFMRLTPENSRATWVAGVTTFVAGGTLAALVGLGGLLLAAAGVISFAWEQAALTLIGIAVVAIGMVIPRKEQ